MDSTTEAAPEGVIETLRTFLQGHFGLVQIGLSVLFIFLWLRARSRDDARSGFRVREADRDLKFDRGGAEAARTADARSAKRPLQLDGIVADGAAHEVLGLSAMASEDEIQKAFKERIKRYHPDRIGPPGSREWQEATRIAEALNRARNEMLEKARRRK